MKKFALLFFVLLIFCGAFVFTRFKKTQWLDVCVMPFHKDEKSASVTLASGQSLQSFARIAQEAGIIADGHNFLFWLARKGVDRTLKAGVYQLNSGPSWYVVEQLKNATPSYFAATILPGALPQTPLPFGTRAEQMAALSDLDNFPQNLRALLPPAPEARAAFLLPETYSLVEGNSFSELIMQASSAWMTKFGTIVTDAQTALRAGIVASLLQREAMKDEEFPVIAGVIENRLAKKMLLQVDASVVYAWYLETGEILKRVLYKHLELDSPYNTYKRSGLPPAPICVPSEAAWQGALEPQKHDYFYYVAGEDGAHRFAKTLAEHEKNAKDYHRSRKLNSSQ